MISIHRFSRKKQKRKCGVIYTIEFYSATIRSLCPLQENGWN
jgi:hypothetical protein